MEQQSRIHTRSLEPFSFSITDQIQSRYLEALEDHHQRYTLSHDGVHPIVHPGILLNQSNATRSPSFGGPNTRWIHVREQTYFAAPARLNDELIAEWHIAEYRPRFGRMLAKVACVVTRHDGPVIIERTMWGIHISGQRPMRAESDRAIPQADAVATTVPSSIQPEPADRQIRGRQKHVTSERIGLFSGRTSQNLHTDDQIAKAAGLPAAAASATQGMGYLCEFMIDNLGEEWLSGGSWRLIFRTPMMSGDHVTALGRVIKAGPTDRADKRTMDLQLVNQCGLQVAQGTATYRRSPPGPHLPSWTATTPGSM
jgi:acyl dehydratase